MMFIEVKPIKATNKGAGGLDFHEGQTWQLNLNMVSYVDYRPEGNSAIVVMADPAQTLVLVKVFYPAKPFPKNIAVPERTPTDDNE